MSTSNTKILLKRARHLRRKRHVRRRLHGTAEKPRMSVYRSTGHIYVQVVDDEAGRTLAAASTLEKELRAELKATGNCDAAGVIGKAIANRAKEKGISSVVFDRNGFRYHGRVKALADAAREGGLEF